MSGAPLIRLAGVFRRHPSGDGPVTVLRAVDLTIRRGDMVAIIGASGSGKSTLMNILGCLDRPSEGEYWIAGRPTAALSADELAALRRERFGFIFQRYHLLGALDAVENVETPAVYAGVPKAARRARATALLRRLGMGDRLRHRPGQLSGGQQQRVSIARALVNDPDVILADEPTGALDSRSGGEVLDILDELNREGRTVVIVTHDRAVAARAARVIEIRDGAVVADRRNRAPADVVPIARPRPARRFGGRFAAAFAMALRSIGAHRLRSFLTMLGVVIGIASVVCVVALGQGAQEKILSDISDMGANSLAVFPGRGFGDLKAEQVVTLTVDDAREIARLPYVKAATPKNAATTTVRVDDKEINVQVIGVGAQYFRTRNSAFVAGHGFGRADVDAMAQDAVIDDNARKALFPHAKGPETGAVVLMKNLPVRVVGVLKPDNEGEGAQNPEIYLPYTTVSTRMTGSRVLQSIVARIDDAVDSAQAEKLLTAFLARRHGAEDFFVYNSDKVQKTVRAATGLMALLIAAIAGISLFVGGVGVMNIMLVAVSERVAEIGLRMAVGARRSDILQQFLIEAVLVCLLGGLVGVALAGGFGLVFAQFDTGFRLIYSPLSIAAALLCSSLIGIGFGFAPARNASRLDPVVTLARD